MATPKTRKSSGNGFRYNPLNALKSLFTMLIALFVRIKDNVTGKTTANKAKNLGETVAQQQEMVKEAEETFAMEKQKAERNFDEVKRSMAAHKMALDMGPPPTQSESANLGMTGEGGASVDKSDPGEGQAESEQSQDSDSQEGQQKSVDEKPSEPEGDKEFPGLFDILNSIDSNEDISAIGGLTRNGELLNPFDINQWLTEGDIAADVKNIKENTLELLRDGKGKPLNDSDKTTLKTLLFEQLAGSLMAARPSTPTAEHKKQVSCTLAYLWHSASEYADTLADLSHESKDPSKVDQSMEDKYEELLSKTSLDKHAECLKKFLNNFAYDEPGNTQETPGRVKVEKEQMFSKTTNWLTSMKDHYQGDLAKGNLFLHSSDLDDSRSATLITSAAGPVSNQYSFYDDLASANEKDSEAKKGNPDAGPETVEAGEGGTTGSPSSDSNTSKKADAAQAPSPADEQDGIEVHESYQSSEELPFGPNRKREPVADYQPSMQSTDIPAVTDTVPGSTDTEEQNNEASQEQKNGRSYKDITSVPVSDGLSL